MGFGKDAKPPSNSATWSNSGNCPDIAITFGRAPLTKNAGCFDAFSLGHCQIEEHYVNGGQPKLLKDLDPVSGLEYLITDAGRKLAYRGITTSANSRRIGPSGVPKD